MAITISGENNNDRILAQDGVIDQISGINIVGLITASHINVGSNINLGNAGIVTATTFVGNLTGNVNSTSPLLLQTGGSERFRITGDNALGIAGANYGSSGQVLTSGGSGSAVTWSAIPSQVTIASNADNRVITGGSGTNLVGESTLTYDGNDLTQTTNANGEGIKINGGNNSSSLTFNANRGTQAVLGVVYGRWNSTTVAQMSFVTGDDGTDKNDGYITFGTESAASNGNVNATERLRINSSGQVSLGNNPTVASDAALHIELDGTREYLRLNADAGNNNAYIEIQADDNRRKALIFKSGGTRRGVIGVGDSDEATNATSLFFSASTNIGGNSPHMVITSTGKVGINETTPDTQLHVSGNANAQTTAGAGTNTAIRITDTDTSAQSGQVYGEIQFETRDVSSAGVAAYLTAQGNSSGQASMMFGTGAGGSASTKMVLHHTGNASLGYQETAPNEYTNQTTFTINGNTYGRLDLEVAGTLKGSVWANTGGLGLDAGGNDMEFYTGSAQSLKITNTGALQHTAASGLSYFTGSSEYIIGSTSSSPPAGGYESVLQVQGAKTRSAFTVAAYMNNSGGPFMTFLSSRSGTVGTLGTKCLNGDNLGGIRFAGDNATNYNTVAIGAEIAAFAASTPGDGDSVIAGRMKFATGTANAGSSNYVMELREDGQLNLKRGRTNNNGSLLYCEGGYIAGTGTITFNVPVYSSGNVYKIDMFYSHHSLAYGAYRYGVYGAYSGHSGVQINTDFGNHSSGNGGSWTITRGNAGTDLVITKTAGTYGGQGYWFINVYAGYYTQL